ncbi:MAG: hypothetical protein ACRD36_13360, partial [Candidatus Acidiferrum sp.]
LIWNDARNSAAGSVTKWRDLFFSRRSAIYWRPLLAIHLGYCPHKQRLRSLCQYYCWYLWRNDPRVQRLGWLLRPLRNWWRWLESLAAKRRGPCGELTAPNTQTDLPFDRGAAA